MFKVYKACIDSVSLCLIHRGVNKYTMSWTSNCAKKKKAIIIGSITYMIGFFAIRILMSMKKL